MEALKQELQAVMTEAADIWNTQKYADLERLWDTDDEQPFYLAEEQFEWFGSWAQVRDYWEVDPHMRVLEASRMTYTLDAAKLLAPDVAQAIGWVQHDLKIIFRDKPSGGRARVNVTFRKKAGAWKFVSYTEAPITAAMYLQDLMEKGLEENCDDDIRSVIRKEQGPGELGSDKTEDPHNFDCVNPALCLDKVNP